LLLGTSVEIAHIGKVLRIPSIDFNEDAADVVPLHSWLGYPFINKIITTVCCSLIYWESKGIKYNGYHELAYFYPNYFCANKNNVVNLLKNNKRYFMIRFSKLTAHHDIGKTGINDSLTLKIVEATLSTPSSQKIYQGETKQLLREALKDILPTKITNRKDKKGFSNPRDKWFRTAQFQKYIFELINSESFKNRGYFDSVIANTQYKKHLEGKIDCSKEIWKWINLEVWFGKFID